jgi:hypothetical protein
MMRFCQLLSTCLKATTDRGPLPKHDSQDCYRRAQQQISKPREMAPPVTTVQEKLRKKTCDHLIIFVLGSGQDKANRLNQYTKFAERGIETTGHGSTHQVRQQTTVTCLCAQSKDPRNRKKQTLKVHRHGSRQIQTRPVAWETKAQESKVVRTNSHRTRAPPKTLQILVIPADDSQRVQPWGKRCREACSSFK